MKSKGAVLIDISTLEPSKLPWAILVIKKESGKCKIMNKNYLDI